MSCASRIGWLAQSSFARLARQFATPAVAPDTAEGTRSSGRSLDGDRFELLAQLVESAGFFKELPGGFDVLEALRRAERL